MSEKNYFKNLKEKYDYCSKIQFIPFPSASPELLEGYIINCREFDKDVDLNSCLTCPKKTNAIWRKFTSEQNYKKYCEKCDCSTCANECDKCKNCDLTPTTKCSNKVKMR